MRVLLLGGAGFIGSNLVSELFLRGHDISVLEPEHVLIDRIKNLPVHLYRGSLSDIQLIDSIISINGIEIIIHLASTLIPGSDFPAFKKDLTNIMIPSVQLMDICARLHVKLAYFSSGGTVYGNRTNGSIPFQETDPLEPISYYGWSKQLIENCLRNSNRINGLQYIIFRPSNAYGPGQNIRGKQGFIAVALGKILHGEKITVWGDGSAVRDYIYIDDLVHAVCDVLSDETIINTTLNVGSGIGYSINEILEIIRDITHESIIVNYLDARKEDVSRIVLNNSELAKRIPFSPISIHEGIRRFYLSLSHGL